MIIKYSGCTQPPQCHFYFLHESPVIFQGSATWSLATTICWSPNCHLNHSPLEKENWGQKIHQDPSWEVLEVEPRKKIVTEVVICKPWKLMLPCEPRKRRTFVCKGRRARRVRRKEKERATDRYSNWDEKKGKEKSKHFFPGGMSAEASAEDVGEGGLSLGEWSNWTVSSAPLTAASPCQPHRVGLRSGPPKWVHGMPPCKCIKIFLGIFYKN